MKLFFDLNLRYDLGSLYILRYTPIMNSNITTDNFPLLNKKSFEWVNIKFQDFDLDFESDGDFDFDPSREPDLRSFSCFSLLCDLFLR